MTPETLIVHGADRQSISKLKFDGLVKRLTQAYFAILKESCGADFRIQDVFWSKGHGFVQCTSKMSMDWTKAQVAKYNGPDKRPLRACDQSEYDQYTQCTVALR